MIEKIDFTYFRPHPGMPMYDPSTYPDIKIATVSNQWVKMMYFKREGDYIPGHEHTFDHLTLLAKGSVEVQVNEEKTTFVAPALIFIQKNTAHQICALEAGSIACCIHALRDGEAVEDIISTDMIPRGVDPLSMINDFNLTPLAKPLA